MHSSSILLYIVYEKSNELHPLTTIFVVFVRGILLGLTDIIFALSLFIVPVTTYKFYEQDISDKLDDMKKGKKKE